MHLGKQAAHAARGGHDLLRRDLVEAPGLVALRARLVALLDSLVPLRERHVALLGFFLVALECWQ